MVKKLDQTDDRLKLPTFDSEVQEAAWWFEHRGQVEANLAEAMQEGKIQRGSAQRLVKEARASKNITIRMSVEDLERARQLSAKRGLAYQTYMKMLLHEALDQEEKRLVA
jgi:predicted DNA binding CopG/RHH family protein